MSWAFSIYHLELRVIHVWLQESPSTTLTTRLTGGNFKSKQPLLSGLRHLGIQMWFTFLPSSSATRKRRSDTERLEGTRAATRRYEQPDPHENVGLFGEWKPTPLVQKPALPEELWIPAFQETDRCKEHLTVSFTSCKGKCSLICAFIIVLIFFLLSF